MKRFFFERGSTKTWNDVGSDLNRFELDVGICENWSADANNNDI